MKEPDDGALTDHSHGLCRDRSTQRVLVTGAFGLIGTATVAALTQAGHSVTATDLGIRTYRRRAAAVAAQTGAQVYWADLIRAEEVTRLIRTIEPTVIVHLAALIPPFCYARRELARRVNVDATASLTTAAATMPRPPRFVLASSVAVYGARNPHSSSGLLTAGTQRRPTELYGSLKAQAEDLVVTSNLEWVVLRLGGVLWSEPRWNIDRDLISFEATLPADGRIHTVDVRDVAGAFTSAVVTQQVRQVFMVGGDDTHRVTQAGIGASTATAMGLRGGFPTGRPGNPSDDLGWFGTDWMDTDHSQEVLDFQRHSLPDMYRQLRASVGWRRPLLRLLAPLVRAYLARRSPYRGVAGRFADPWTIIGRRWGDPSPAPALAAGKDGGP